MLKKITILGVGRISLGLLLPWLARSGAEIALVNRRTPQPKPFRSLLKRNRRYRLRMGGLEFEQAGFVDLLEYDSNDPGGASSREAIEWMRDSDLITVSVGAGNLKDVAKVIEFAARGSQDRPLHLAAFENMSRATSELQEHVLRESSQSQQVGAVQERRPIVAHWALPDRACLREFAVETDEVVLETEPFGEVAIGTELANVVPCEDPSPGAPYPCFKLVPEEAVELAEARKFWFVNGTHVVLGFLCKRFTLPSFAYAMSKPEVRQIVEETHEEWAAALADWASNAGLDLPWLSLEGLKELCEQVTARVESGAQIGFIEVLKELKGFEPPVVAGSGEPSASEVRRYFASQVAPLVRLQQKVADRLAAPVMRAYGADLTAATSGFMLAIAVDEVRKHMDLFPVG